MSPRLTLDHLGVAVRDLSQARASYTKIGFNLTDLSIHSGQPAADGKVQPLGSGNHCAMFRQGYMELIGVVDPDKPSSVGPFLKSRQGGFITALGCDNADAAYGAAAQDFPTAQRPVALERLVIEPDGSSEKAQFRNILMGAGFPETRLLLIQHLTRDVVWREREMVHPNGVVALIGARFLVADATEAALRYGRLIGARPETKRWGTELDLSGQTLQFFSEPEKGAPEAHCPSLYGAVFAVLDLGKTEALFASNGVPFHKTEAGELLVSPDEACGFALTFTILDTHTP